MAEQYDVIVTDEDLGRNIKKRNISAAVLNSDRLQDFSEGGGLSALLRDGGVFCFDLASSSYLSDCLDADAGELSFTRVFAPAETETDAGLKDQHRDGLRAGLAHCDVLIVNENQVRQLTGRSDYDDGVDDLIEEFHIPMIILNMGASGSAAFSGSSKIFVPNGNADDRVPAESLESVRLNVLGSVFSYLLEQGIKRSEEYDIRELEEVLSYIQN